MDRFGDKVCCNPTVKLKKQESYPVIDIDKITPGYKAVRSVVSIEYTGQGGAKFQDHDVLLRVSRHALKMGRWQLQIQTARMGLVRQNCSYSVVSMAFQTRTIFIIFCA